MQKITLNLSNRPAKNCTICIGVDAFKELASLYDFSSYSKAFVVTDQVVEPLLLKGLTNMLPLEVASLALPAGEHYKDTKHVQRLWQAMHEADCDRKSLIINLGGGVISDIGGFAAATYMRGLDFLNIPTTLLAQVDASVGGKTGCNFAGVKNLIGSFSQPIGILIDPQLLATLPEREFSSGFGEILKHGLVADADYFAQVSTKQPRQFSPEELEAIITQSCRIKLAIVENDETEGGVRKIVNFGHTIGHAIEALSHETAQPLLHGEAVGIGIVAESYISHALGLLPLADLELIEHAVSKANLPTTVPNFDHPAILRKMRSDKKNEARQVNFTLLEAIGKARYNQAVPEQTVIEILHKLQSTHP